MSTIKRFLLYFPLAALSLLGLLIFTGSCSSSSASPEWIFFITLDTTRADHINLTPGNPDTPNLAELAARGQYFEHAYSLIPITLPSHATMFFSMPPHRLKIYNNGQVQHVQWPSLAELLKNNGYDTSAVISLGVLKSGFGLEKGFDHYIENFPPYLWLKTAEHVNRDAFKHIRSILAQTQTGGDTNGQKHFLWLHYSDPHEPYFPPSSGQSAAFRITLDNNEILKTLSTEQPAIDITFLLPPGEHTLDLETTIPDSFLHRSDSPFELKYIKYRDLVLQPEDTVTTKDDTNSQTAPGSEPAVIFPQDWNHRITRSGVNYYSTSLQSQLTLKNPSPGSVQMKLRFFYSLQVDDATRKVFYKEEVKYMDRQLGKLFAFLKENHIYDQALFLIIGDHGESLGDYRNHFGHIHFLDSSSVRVPFILAGKGIKARGKCSQPVSTLNAAPTLLAIAGIDKPTHMLGQSVLEPLKHTRLLLETYSPEAYFDAFSIIDFPYQVSFYPGRRKDKMEFANIETGAIGDAAGLDTKSKKMKTDLVNAVLKISRIITATKGKPGKTGKRHQEILKSLGYL